MEEEYHVENPYDEKFEERILQVNEIVTLYNLHHDIWDETLLEPPFFFYYQRVLHPRERQVVDGRIAGKSNKQIAKNIGISESTVQRYAYNVRYIFRNKSRQRIYKFWEFRKRIRSRKLPVL